MMNTRCYALLEKMLTTRYWKKMLIIAIGMGLILNVVTIFCTRLTIEYYNCTLDYCLCCFTSNNINQQPTKIGNLSRLFLNEGLQTDYTQFSDTQLKQIQNSKMVYYRTCSNPDSFEWYPVIDKNMWSKHISETVDNGGITKCLREFCANSTSTSFHCHDDNIQDLDTDYEEMWCFSTMQYVIIESSNLISIGNEAFFANRNIQWNIIYLRINFATTAPVTITCNAFQLLTKLRTLKLDLHYFKSYKCIFHFNPDLVTISSYNIRIWNMCNGSLDVWKDGEYRNETILDTNSMIRQEVTNFKKNYFMLFIAIFAVVSFLVACLQTNKCNVNFLK